MNLAQVRVIPDDKYEIIDCIKEMSEKYAYVFTSGGIGKFEILFINEIILFVIGPTHDDITYESIAAAVNVPLMRHEPTIQKMLHYYRSENLKKSSLKMATIPKADKVYETPGLWVPLVQTNNIMILPGVPLLFKKMVDNWFENELSKFVQRGELYIAPRIRISVKTKWLESDIADKLAQIQAAANEFEIAIGSYPKLFNDGSTFVVISISGKLKFEKEIKKISNEIQESFDGEIFDK